VPPSAAAATSTAATTSTAAATSTAGSVPAHSSPASAAARSEDACPRSGAPDRPSPAAATRERSEGEERGHDDAGVEESEHDEPSGG
jgi:hypothetical protein